MRVLIAAACIAILGVAGHYGWAEWQSAQAEARAEQIASEAQRARNLAECRRVVETPEGRSADIVEMCERHLAIFD